MGRDVRGVAVRGCGAGPVRLRLPLSLSLLLLLLLLRLGLRLSLLHHAHTRRPGTRYAHPVDGPATIATSGARMDAARLHLPLPFAIEALSRAEVWMRSGPVLLSVSLALGV